MIFWVISSTHCVHPPLHSTRLLKHTGLKQEREHITPGSGGPGELDRSWGWEAFRELVGAKRLCQQVLHLLLPMRTPCPGLPAPLPPPRALAGTSSPPSPAPLSLPWRWQTSTYCLSSKTLHRFGLDNSSLSLLTSQLDPSTSLQAFPSPCELQLLLFFSIFFFLPQNRWGNLTSKPENCSQCFVRQKDLFLCCTKPNRCFRICLKPQFFCFASTTSHLFPYSCEAGM